MVKLIGPCFSLAARGTLNDAITYAVLGRTCYAKSYFHPANPKSNAQVGIRAMARFLTQNWKNLTETQQAKFETIAEEWNLSPYHAWLRLNARRWNSHQMPISDLDYTLGPIFSWQTPSFEKTGRIYELELELYEAFRVPFSAEFCLATNSGFTPARSNAKIITNNVDIQGSWAYFYGTWLAPDDATYYMKARFAVPSGIASPFASA